MNKRIISFTIASLMCLSSLFFSGCILSRFFGYKGSDKKIYIDGGGQNFYFQSYEDKNYSYNAMERLVEEYNNIEGHEFEFVLNDVSLGGNTGNITTGLINKDGPHLLWRLDPNLLNSANLGYYYDLTDALEQPNPYCDQGTAGSLHWKDLYNPVELLATRCSNERYYSVCLDKLPIGFVYNKTMFTQNGWDIPETFEEFCDLCEDINTTTSYQAYGSKYNWYDIFLEVSVYASKEFEGGVTALERMDTLVKDGFISAEEQAYAYYNDLWAFESDDWSPFGERTAEQELYKEFITAVQKRWNCYKNANGLTGQTAYNEFVAGNVAMIELSGVDIVSAAESVTFEVGTFGYPVYGTNGPCRGSAGLTTGYYITNRAIAEGQDKVDACIDFLMYLTAPKQNDILIGEAKASLPISSEATSIPKIFNGLVSQYEQDKTLGTRLDWNVYYPAYRIGENCVNNWNTETARFRTSNLVAVLNSLQASIKTEFENLCTANGWEKDTIGETWGIIK